MSELSEKLEIPLGVPVDMLAVAVKESAIRINPHFAPP
jgi:hypothetical protein